MIVLVGSGYPGTFSVQSLESIFKLHVWTVDIFHKIQTFFSWHNLLIHVLMFVVA